MHNPPGDQPRISVVMPVYNGEQYLDQAIQSVLDQEYALLELLVIDDGSADGTARVANRYLPTVQYHYREHAGLAATRNFGTAVATGEFLAFLDADDVWAPGKLTRQVAALRADPTLDAVFGRMEQFVSPELDRAIQDRLRPRVADLAALSPCTLLIRTESYRRVGELDPAWKVGEFLDWLLKAREHGLRTQMLEEVVLRRRIHRDNMGLREKDSRGDYARILKASLERRRRSL
jgi:glycosyltransferase involved in cell wall biosynthesis